MQKFPAMINKVIFPFLSLAKCFLEEWSYMLYVEEWSHVCRVSWVGGLILNSSKTHIVQSWLISLYSHPAQLVPLFLSESAELEDLVHLLVPFSSCSPSGKAKDTYCHPQISHILSLLEAHPDLMETEFLPAFWEGPDRPEFTHSRYALLAWALQLSWHLKILYKRQDVKFGHLKWQSSKVPH